MGGKTEAIIRDFFNRYAIAAAEGDADHIAGAYFHTYIEASPGTVVAYAVDADYKKAVSEKSRALKRQLGLARTEVEVRDIKEFAPAHYLVEVEWTMRFQPTGKKPVESIFTISYVVRFENETPKILLYVSHVDEEAAMKRDGLI